MLYCANRFTDQLFLPLITFRVRRIRGEMFIGHGRLCVCLCLSVCITVCLSLAAFPHYCTDPNVSWGNGRWCPLVVHYWADLHSLHGTYGFRCYDNIAPNAKCQRVLVLAPCLVHSVNRQIISCNSIILIILIMITRPPPRQTEVGTVSLPARSRYIGLKFSRTAP